MAGWSLQLPKSSGRRCLDRRAARGCAVGREALPQPRGPRAVSRGREWRRALAPTPAHGVHGAVPLPERSEVRHASRVFFVSAFRPTTQTPQPARSRRVRAARLGLTAVWLVTCSKRISGIKLCNPQCFFPDVCHLRLRLCNPKYCPPAPQPRNP